jgi:multiple sugar transport system ATP-binding protein
MTKAHSPDTAIELERVSKLYGKRAALVDVSLRIGIDEFVVLLGPSGCGKSTLLKIIAGLEDPSDGEIYIGDRMANYIQPANRNVAMVFQNYALYPHMSVARNIGFPLRMGGMKRSEVTTRVAEAAALLDLSEFLHALPEQLSGGQRQRVAVGRALVRDPIAFLMDEPLSNLDALLRTQMRGELLRLHRRIRRATVYVTHDQVEAMTMADRIVVMAEGKIQQIGTPREIYEEPANIFVGTFVGSPQMNLIREAVVDGGRGRCLRYAGADIPLDGDIVDLARVTTVGIRPEDIEVVRGGETNATVSGRVSLVESFGGDMAVEVAVDGAALLTVRQRHDGTLREGDEVRLRLPSEKIHLFDGAGALVRRQPTPPVPTDATQGT